MRADDFSWAMCACNRTFAVWPADDMQALIQIKACVAELAQHEACELRR